jgi:hypothetical protein
VRGCVEALSAANLAVSFYQISWIDQDTALWYILEEYFKPTDQRSLLVFHLDKLTHNL